MLALVSVVAGLSWAYCLFLLGKYLQARHRRYLENLVFDRLLEVLPLLVRELQVSVVQALLKEK